VLEESVQKSEGSLGGGLSIRPPVITVTLGEGEERNSARISGEGERNQEAQEATILNSVRKKR